MAANKEPIYIGNILGKITELSDTTETDIFLGDASESTRIDALVVTTDDTAAKDLVILFHDGTVSKKATTVSVPLTSGMTNAATPVNLLGHAQMASHVCLDAAGNKYLNLPPGWKLRAAEAAAPTSGKKMWVFARGGKY
jgi:hypothetical protein